MKFTSGMAMFVATAVSGLVLPAPEGPYAVHWESAELVDKSRLDPFDATHPRRIMVSHFSPVARGDCKETGRVPYMSPEIAAVEDEILAEYLGDGIWPRGLLGSLELEVCTKVGKLHSHDRGHKFLTLLFGPGLNTTRLYYSATAQSLASKGYEVIVLDHPYETDVVQFPDGELIFGGRIAGDPSNITNIQFGLNIRTQDVSFVLNTFKIRQTVYLGHSFGGASAASAMLKETRIASGVNIDGALWGRVVPLGVPRPFLAFASTGHNSSTDPSWGEFYTAMDEKHPDVWAKELGIKDSKHSGLSDYSLIADVAGLREDPTLEAFIGKISGARVRKILSAYLSDFVEFTLTGGEEGLLTGPSEDHPDVEFLANI